MKRLRKSRIHPSSKQPILSLAAATIIAISFTLIVVTYLLTSTRRPKLPNVVFGSTTDIPDDVISSLDAVVVLGGGVPLSPDEPPLYVQQRCDDAAFVVQKHASITKRSTDFSLPILCLSAGTAHLPQLLSADGLPVWESTASAAYLHEKFKMIKNVYVETTSYDTIGNAFFTRASFTDINGWRKLLVVTNEFHMDRTKAIFEWIFSLDAKPDSPYELSYLASKDVGLSESAVAARKEREEKSLQTVVNKLAPQFQSMTKVWTFLNENHDLYTAEMLVKRAKATKSDSVADDVKKSYGGK